MPNEELDWRNGLDGFLLTPACPLVGKMKDKAAAGCLVCATVGSVAEGGRLPAAAWRSGSAAHPALV